MDHLMEGMDHPMDGMDRSQVSWMNWQKVKVMIEFGSVTPLLFHG
jgi:hypothetical protein